MNKSILKLAIPNLISNVTVPLLGAIDLAMIGRIDSLTAVGAISLGAMIFNFIYWSLGFLRMGTCGFTSQAFGSGNKEETVLTLFRSLFIAGCGAFLLIVLQKPILQAALLWTRPEPDLAEATARYFQIRIWAAPATISAFAFSGWFIGLQDAKTPMWTAICINLFNILFNYIFVFVQGLGSDGVALGTLCAQYGGLLLNIGFALRILRNKYPAASPANGKGKNSARASFPWMKIRASAVFQTRALNRFLHVNSDIFLRTLIIIFIFSFFTAESSRLGKECLVLNTLLYQFFIFYSYAMDGFAHAAEALSGKYTGGGLWFQKRKTVKQIFHWGTGTALFFCIGYAVLYTPILRIFTHDSGILTMSRDYYFWILGIALIGFPAFLWDGIYAGSLATKRMLLTMALAAAGFLSCYFLCRGFLHNHAMWLAMTVFLILRGGLMTLWAPHVLNPS